MSSTSVITIDEILNKRRINDVLTKVFTTAFFLIGVVLLIIRTFIGIHAFIVACLLRKTNAIRCIVMRFMCAILGIVIRQHGERDDTASVLCSNHVSILDHLAIDLVSPCLLPSIWDIPTVIRWCFGYVDLGASIGRGELVRNAKKLLADGQGPLLAFPEGEITNGKKALLKFNTWCFEISDSVQPVAVTVYRPIPWNVAVSQIASSWLSDLILFFALPFTVIHVHYLPKVTRNDDESIDEFTLRVANRIADELGIHTSNFETRDVAEAAKRWRREQAMLRDVAAGGTNKNSSSDGRIQNDRQLDECAMRIKQSHPSFHLSLIREDLGKTRNQAATVANLKNGKIPKDLDVGSGKVSLDPSSWKSIFSSRKWQMIETNRSKYLQRDG